MTFTTSSGDTWTVRLYIGDTVQATAKLSDESIQQALDSEGGDVLAGAALASEWKAASYAGDVDKRVGSLSLSGSQAFEHYMRLAEQLRAKGAVLGGMLAGGISVSGKQAIEADTDRVVPAFRVDMLDNPLVTSGSVNPFSETE